jgi:tRNA (guanine-N7-)-methyltransferase
LVRTLLPRLRIDPREPLRAFDAPVSELRLEIGFGGGEHLAAQARTHPGIGFIGCEPFVNGVAKLLAVVDREGLCNIRIWDADATELIGLLPPGSLGGVDLLYPDPWPKRRHRKRRFVSDDGLAALARVMAPGALFRFTTDIDDYAGWALARALRSRALAWTAERPDDWRQPWPGWPGTRYEAKAAKEGRRPAYLTFQRLPG